MVTDDNFPQTTPLDGKRHQFFKNMVGKNEPLSLLISVQIKSRVKSLLDIQYGSYMKSDQRLSGFGESQNWQKRFIFWELSY